MQRSKIYYRDDASGLLWNWMFAVVAPKEWLGFYDYVWVTNFLKE